MKFCKVFAMLAAAALCTNALAGGDECQKSCSQTKSGCTEGSLSACATKAMPKMVVMVGDKTFECPMSAGDCAKKEGKPVVYSVNGKKFEDQEKAFVAYADAMDQFVVRFTAVRTMEECMKDCGSSCASDACTSNAKTCDATKSTCTAGKNTGVTGTTGGTCTKSGGASKDTTKVAAGGCCEKDGKVASAANVFCVAGQCFDSRDKADKAAQVVAVAIKEVKLSYKVGEKSFCCDKMAGEEATKTSQKIMYVVGQDCTPCNIMGRVNLAKAKVAAAVKALETKQITKA